MHPMFFHGKPPTSKHQAQLSKAKEPKPKAKESKKVQKETKAEKSKDKEKHEKSAKSEKDKEPKQPKEPKQRKEPKEATQKKPAEVLLMLSLCCCTGLWIDASIAGVLHVSLCQHAPICQAWEILLADKLQVKKEVEVAKPERKESISKESTDSKESDSKELESKDPKTTDEVEDAKDSGMRDHVFGVHVGMKQGFDKAPKAAHFDL